MGDRLHAHPTHILQRLKINDNHMNFLIWQYLQTLGNAPNIAVIRITDEDFFKPAAESRWMLTRDILPPDKAMYNYNFNKFKEVFYDAVFSHSVFGNCDFLILADCLTDVQVYVPLLLKRDDRLMIFGTARQNSSAIRLLNEPHRVILEEYEGFILIKISKNNECGIVEDNPTLYWDKVKQRIFLFPQQLSKQSGRENHTAGYNFSCAIGLLFLTYKLGDSADVLKNYVYSNPVHQILETILSTRNTRLMVIIKTVETGIVYTDFNDISYSRHFYNDFYWFSKKNDMLGHIPTETLTCIGTEDIIWIVVNPSDNIYNWNIVISVASVFSFILIGSLVFERIIGHRFPVQMSVLLMWSIFLTVSIPRQPRRFMYRVLFLSWTLSCSALTLCYYFKLFTALSVPTVTRYSSSAEIFHSDILRLTYIQEYSDLATGEIGVHQRKKTTSNTKAKPFFEYLKENAVAGTEFALLLDRKHIERFLAEIPEAPYYIVADKVASYPNCFYSSYRDQLTAHIRRAAARLGAAGIIDRLTKQVRRENTKGSGGAITLKDLLNVFLLMGVLYLIATIIFICEVVSKLRMTDKILKRLKLRRH